MPLRSALAESTVLVAVFDSEQVLHDPQEQQLMRTFADHVGLALDRARALEDREEMAVLSDRDRIARDMHDLVIQRLFATGMQLQGLRMLADRPELVEAIDNAVDNIDTTIRDIRGTIFELHGRQDASLRGAVRRLAKEYVPALGFAPSVRTVGPVDTAVPAGVQVELLTVLRETLSNVAQHARARHAGVELEVTGDDVVVRVSDDGVGLPEERVESGLENARLRARALGGSFEVASESAGGTVATWRVPLAVKGPTGSPR
jgi:signal transduction histidine kinase